MSLKLMRFPGAHDIGAEKVVMAWLTQRGIALQVGRVVEYHIEGPLVPVLTSSRRWMFTEDLGMNGVELACDAVEQLGPQGFD